MPMRSPVLIGASNASRKRALLGVSPLRMVLIRKRTTTPSIGAASPPAAVADGGSWVRRKVLEQSTPGPQLDVIPPPGSAARLSPIVTAATARAI
jgi:hypothetical protein